MDFTKLEKELSGLMQKDDKYWRENDAKFRAAKQMATYEEFENIVKVRLFGQEYLSYNKINKVIKQTSVNQCFQIFQASHLKPLEKSDHVQEMYRDGAKGNSLVNPVVGSSGITSIEKIKMEKKLNEES